MRASHSCRQQGGAICVTGNVCGCSQSAVVVATAPRAGTTAVQEQAIGASQGMQGMNSLPSAGSTTGVGALVSLSHSGAQTEQPQPSGETSDAP